MKVVALENFTIILIAILLEALPFVIIGVVLSGLIEEFVPPAYISKLIPHGIFFSVFAGALLGMILPLCECVSVIVVRRLLKKGVPIASAITYMLSGPVINPVTLASTLTAYSWHPQMVLWRASIAILAAVITGVIIQILCKDNIIKNQRTIALEILHVAPNKSLPVRFQHAFFHAIDDFLMVFPLLLFGATLAALFKAFAPTEVFVFFKQQQGLSIVVFAVLAVLLSLCSEADAFVASSLNGIFNLHAQLAFLCLGPMLDLKLMAVYQRVFEARTFLILCIVPPFLIISTCIALWGVQ